MSIDLEAAFNKFEADFIQFEMVENKRSNRPDLHAFILLDELLPSEKARDMVSAAEHDEIWLDVDCGQLARVITESQVQELVRCGVRYEEDTESLALFV